MFLLNIKRRKLSKHLHLFSSKPYFSVYIFIANKDGISQLTLQLSQLYIGLIAVINPWRHKLSTVGFYCQGDVRIYIGLTSESGLGKGEGMRLF